MSNFWRMFGYYLCGCTTRMRPAYLQLRLNKDKNKKNYIDISDYDYEFNGFSQLNQNNNI